MTIDGARALVNQAAEAGIGGVIVFGIPTTKDALGSSAWDDDGIVQRTVRAIRADAPDLVVATDVCLCQYTDHGHCGVLLDDGTVDNDPTLELLARTATSHANAGADVVAPSDMMDGRISALRMSLDRAGQADVAIMSYAAKYASAFYGPFRGAAGSAPKQGDRSTYQMDPAQRREARLEVLLDEREGADILMVKPALSCLDIISDARHTTARPIAAYHVSGEYAALHAAADRGWLDYERALMESLTAITRAGAHIILTYGALDAARLID